MFAFRNTAPLRERLSTAAAGTAPGARNRRSAFFGCALFLLLAPAIGCGEDTVPPTFVNPDAGPGAAPQRNVEVRITPSRGFYRTGQAVRPNATVRDAEGNEVAVPVTWRIRPATAAEAADDGVYTLAEEGMVEFEACVPSGTVEACDFNRIIVDNAAPTLEVTSPLPGAELGGDGATSIEVVGSVSDTRDVNVYVNGAEAEVDTMGMFRATVSPLFGLNHIDVFASDGVGEQTRVEFDVLWADRYLQAVNADMEPEVMFDEALQLQLGQPFFDDGTPLDTSVSPPVAGDLADVLELLLGTLDLNALLPNPILSGSAGSLSITDLQASEISSRVDIVPDGVELFVRIGNLDADTMGELTFEGSTLDLDGGLSASAAIFGRLTLSKAGPDAPVESTVSDLNIALENVTGNFRSAEANALLRLAEGALRGAVETAIVGLFEETLREALPVVITEAFDALDGVLKDQRFEFDNELLGMNAILLDGGLSTLRREYRRWIQAPLALTIGTESAAVHPMSRGVPDAEEGTPPFFATRKVQMGVRLAMVNGLLHALWNSGLLNVDVSSALPESVAGAIQEANLEGRLPPMLRAGRGNEEHALILSIGQAELDLLALGERTRYGISIEAGANLALEDGNLALVISDEPEIRVWLIESEAARPVVDEPILEALLTEQLWPTLREAVAALSFEVPTFSIGDLTTIAPELSDVGLSLSLSEEIREQNGWLMVNLDIEAGAPAE